MINPGSFGELSGSMFNWLEQMCSSNVISYLLDSFEKFYFLNLNIYFSFKELKKPSFAFVVSSCTANDSLSKNSF
jgi:hypothetical protein